MDRDAPARTDPVWKCAGCAHGFLVTYKFKPQVGLFAYWGTYEPDEPHKKGEKAPSERDATYCLCASPTMLEARDEDSTSKRVRLDQRVVACDGFVMKPDAATPTEPRP